MEKMREVGFIGLGKMGGAMAERLLSADIRLHVFDPSAAAMERFTSCGAIAHASALSVADAAPLIFACLPNQQVSHATVFGPDGILQGKAVRVYAEMSTIGKDLVEQIAAGLAAKGIETVDSPISGGPPGARAGTLAIMVSGQSGAIELLMPLLRKIGKEVYVLGERPGMAQIMKLVNNLIMAANMIVASEGLVMGAKAGLDADMMMNILNAGTGRSAAASDILSSAALSGTFNFGAALSIIEKDMAVGLREANMLQVPMPVIEGAGREWHAAYAAGRGDDDFSTIIQVVEERGGARVRR